MGVAAPAAAMLRVASPPTLFPRGDVDTDFCRADGRIGPFHLFRIDPVGTIQRLTFPTDSGAVAVALAGGRTRIGQRGLSVLLSAGEWTLLRPGQGVEFEGLAPVQVALLPARELSERNLSLSRLMLNRFSRDSSVNRVTYSMLRAIFDEAGQVHTACAGELGRAALYVLKRALIDNAGSRPPREILGVRIREFVDWNIRDPDLSPETIARALRCSPRNIHRAFAGGAETLSQYVLRLRLERCRADLMAAGRAQRSVTEIAFSWGFNNGAHFSRVFKRQFGRSPRACRSNANDPGA